MFKKVRRKFIISAMFATLVVTLALIISINLINYMQVTRNLKAVMDEMDPRQVFSAPQERAEKDEADMTEPDVSSQAYPPDFHREMRNTAEVQYAGRYFTILVDENGTSHASGGSFGLDDEEASALASDILSRGRASGIYNNYLYEVREIGNEGSKQIRLLDCTTELKAMRSLLLTSILVGLGGLLLTFLFICRMSEKAIWPLRESMEKQKRFITDAGHELKTPLSVIGTNMDILAMDLPDNEWVKGTKKQVGKLRGLIEHLISLSRLEEAQSELKMKPFNLSQAVQDTADAFEGIGDMNNTPICTRIAENLTVTADEASVVQLLTILTDNALEYALPDTDVELRLFRQGRHVCFETINAWDRSTPSDQLDRFFDRFYRGDPSRSGGATARGYGLGLSIAQAIAARNHLTLHVSEDEAHRIVFQVLFP